MERNGHEGHEMNRDGSREGPGRTFPRISKHLADLKTSYDHVVIGSGYGGGIAASRLARASQSVCVLELGDERWPGEYPATTTQMVGQLNVSGCRGLRGNKTDLYQLKLGDGLGALVGTGLGGTSLINSGVFLQADEDTLQAKQWPPEIRGDPSALNKCKSMQIYYQKVRDVLEPERYPDALPEVYKTQALRRQADILGVGQRFYKTPLTTRFRDDGRNSCGVQMSASTLSGQDCTGINDGSKTTTLASYLADAWNWGADLFCRCEVRHVEELPDGGGYIVYFAWHDYMRHGWSEVYDNLMWVHAKKAVFFGAGSLGTTEILLRSKQRGLRLSCRVGQGLNGNGDVLAFGYNTDSIINAMGNAVPGKEPPGPTITSVIDGRTGAMRHEKYLVQDGAVPQACELAIQLALASMTWLRRSDAAKTTKHRAPKARRKGGTMKRTQVFLIMSHDEDTARLSLKGDTTMLSLQPTGQNASLQHRIKEMLTEATASLNGTLVYDPCTSLLGQPVTVHPLGGANMSHDNTGRNGATNHAGKLFLGDETTETHAGLIVVDGAAVPSSLCVNPLATIAALAERSIDQYAHANGLKVSEEANRKLDLFGVPAHVAEDVAIDTKVDSQDAPPAPQEANMTFSELLLGQMCAHDDVLLNRADAHSKPPNREARLFVSVDVYASANFGGGYKGAIVGSFTCPSLVGSPFMIRRRSSSLSYFTTDDTVAEGTRITYEFDMVGIDGRILHFHGFKSLSSATTLSPSKVWRSTVDLHVEIFDELTGPCVKGFLKVQPTDLAPQLMSLKSKRRQFKDAFRFTNYFARHSIGNFFTPFRSLEYASMRPPVYANPTTPSVVYSVRARDGAQTNLYMWEPQRTIPFADNLFMVPGAGVDHQIFALPTIPVNAVNYFTQAGYRVFVTVPRIGGVDVPVGEPHWTTYDARLDILAALEHIRTLHGPRKVYTIAHCMGAVALSSGLLDGTIPADWLLGLTCSQVFCHPIWDRVNMTKSHLQVIQKAYKAAAGNWFECKATKKSQRAMNQVLRLYPTKRHELCRSASCHRMSLVFGRCWSHANLNHATHRFIDRFFGGVNMTQLVLLMAMGRQGVVMDNARSNLSTDDNLGRVRHLPIYLFVGGDNAVLAQEATQTTYKKLCEQSGALHAASHYRWRVVPGYGHLDCWMGKDAWRDVYPLVRDEVDRVVRQAPDRVVVDRVLP